jgi:four helix bundle protein
MVVGGWFRVLGSQFRACRTTTRGRLPHSCFAVLMELGRSNRPIRNTANRLQRSSRMNEERSFRRLDVWQEAMTLVEEIYRQSKQFPSDERFGLTAQLRRAAVSVPSNIGEGARRKRRKAHLNHLDIALGSQGEVEVQLEIALRLGYCTRKEYDGIQERVSRVGRMLNGLITSLQPENDELQN